jgi:hypothetical protein
LKLALHWQLVPRSSVEHPAAGLRGASAPLFVEEGDASRHAAVPDVENSVWVTSTMPRPALAAGDDPVEILQVKPVHGTEQRFGADEADGHRDFPEVVGVPYIRVGLD